MLLIYEFEVFEDEGVNLAIPYQFDGGTSGSDFGDACEMAAAWLKTTADHYILNGMEMPEPEFGHEPREGGKTVIIVVEIGKEFIARMTAAEAARRLGVSRGRVSQMVDAGLLDTFELDGRKWVTEDSVNARLADKPKAGRPKKAAIA